jgi:Biotin-requiring enzyme
MGQLLLPDLGEGLEEAETVAWHVTEGDHVVVDQPIVSVETDKAVVEVPSPQSGASLVCSVARETWSKWALCLSSSPRAHKLTRGRWLESCTPTGPSPWSTCRSVIMGPRPWHHDWITCTPITLARPPFDPLEDGNGVLRRRALTARAAELMG